MCQKAKDISVVICGAAGQGIQTIEKALTVMMKQAGYHVFATREFMSRIRGGMNSTEIRIANERAASFLNRVDICIPLKQGALAHLKERLSDQTIIIGEKDTYDPEFDMFDIPVSRIAEEHGGKIYANAVATGIVLGMFGLNPDLYKAYFRQEFQSKSEEIVQNNISACGKGYESGQILKNEKGVPGIPEPAGDLAGEILMNGAEAVALGAVAGGCRFVSSYPMSPSTGVLVQCAQYARDLDLVVEQAEDEICAINMALGASYAGAGSLVTTSGGGLALMGEGISLAGMTETPVVIHLAQRPGPATGLPTRTEQGDLNLVLHAGHGEFPRIILAPGDHSQAFDLSSQAFDLAGRFQIPVFILTDQYLMDSTRNIPEPDSGRNTKNTHIIKTDMDYQRFRLTENGISPRGIPGYGNGLVCVDSDEHSEDGYITEDFNVRRKMVDKRLKKMDAMKKACIPPVFHGPEDYETLFICWGTNYHPVKDALQQNQAGKQAMLHFPQIYPVPPAADAYLKQAKRIVSVENNATGQFGRLLTLETGFFVKKYILKYTGLPFSVEELCKEMSRLS